MNTPKKPDQSKPLTFKRRLNQVTAISLFHVLAIMRGSAGEKTHRERLQSDILKAFPEASESLRAPDSEKRIIEIDRRQMFALIYGMVWTLDNIEEVKTELSRVYFGTVDYFSQLKKLSEKIGVWAQVLELIKPDSTPEWEGDFGDLDEGIAGLEESVSDEDDPVPDAKPDLKPKKQK